MADRSITTATEEPGWRAGQAPDEAPMSQLVRELAADGRRLVRDEIGLAKLELKDAARSIAVDGALVAAGAAVGAFGAACLVAALVIGLGVLMDSYWASALIVGVLLVVAGALTVIRGVGSARSARIAPEKTIETLRDDAAWVGDEVRAARREWSGGAA